MVFLEQPELYIPPSQRPKQRKKSNPSNARGPSRVERVRSRDSGGRSTSISSSSAQVSREQNSSQNRTSLSEKSG